MIHSLQHITDLSEICFQAGIGHIVISPGSRNAPLIDAFYSRFGERCYSIVDERSAAYFGLGLARESRKPAALICTSGTAVLNYGPALAEAYYQQIPLVAITADRPAEWIDQQDNQTIRQRDVFKNYIKDSLILPEQIRDERSLKQTHKKIFGIVHSAMTLPKGPVHLNVPLHEPLYDVLPPGSVQPEKFSRDTTQRAETRLPADFLEAWNRAAHILILHGQDLPDPELEDVMLPFDSDKRVVIMAENISNLQTPACVSRPELVLSHSRSDELMPPDLLIYSGGQIVSKRLKSYLRSIDIPSAWRIGTDHFMMDTFRQNNGHVHMRAKACFALLRKKVRIGSPNAFKRSWLNASVRAQKKYANLAASLPFSDLLVTQKVLEEVPAGACIELGNSSPVRLSQLVSSRNGLQYFSNRGVSGIDGCLSSASGAAASSKQPRYLILGDLSFVYDSNALWNRRLPENLRIIVLNNRGGGIFDLLDGPRQKKAFHDFFLAYHPVHIQKLAEAFNLDYFCVRDSEALSSQIPELIKDQKKAVVMEVITNRDVNTKVFRTATGSIDKPKKY